MNLLRLALRSIENPNTPLSSPDAWLVDLAGGKSASGVHVTHQGALKFAALWRGINLLSTDVAKLPLHVYKRIPGGGKERAPEHPAYRLLRRSPTPRVTAFNFIRTLHAHTMIWGNGYGWIIRRRGVPMEIVPVHPQDVTIAYTPDDGLSHYMITRGVQSKRVNFTDMLHIRGLSDDGVQGYDVITVGRETVGLGLAAQRYTSSFFANDATAGVVLTHPETLTPEARENLRLSWVKAHAGVDSKFKAAVLEEGVKVETVTVDAKSAQLMEAREFQLRDIANLLGVPPHKVGDASRRTFASLEQEQRAYLSESVDGNLVAWESETNDKLLTEEEKRNDSHFAEFKREAILAIDHATKVNTGIAEVNNGLLTADEYRDMMNRGPVPNGEGQKFRMPLNIGILGEEPEPEPEPDDDDDDPDDDDVAEASKGGPAARTAFPAHRDLLRDIYLRMLRRIAIHVRKCPPHTKAIERWLDKGLETHRTAVSKALTPAIRAVCAIQFNVGTAPVCAMVIDDFFVLVRDKIERCPPVDLWFLGDAWDIDATILADRALELCKCKPN